MNVMMSSFQDSQHRKEPYSLARDREKCDRKAWERYGFEDMVSFAFVSFILFFSFDSL
jgi:hypothetical protein